jgi:hypothetical protein
LIYIGDKRTTLVGVTAFGKNCQEESSEPLPGKYFIFLLTNI